MEVRTYFNSIAHQWNEIRKGYFRDELSSRVINRGKVRNKIVCDLGCGTGFMALEASKKAKLVFGLDGSDNMLRELNNAKNRLNIKNLYPIKAQLEELPLFDESIDVIFMNMALHHVETPLNSIKEMNRILKAGGKVVISDVEKHDAYWAREEMHDYWLGFSHEELINWFKEAGFKEVKVETTDLYCEGVSNKGEYIKADVFILEAKK